MLKEQYSHGSNTGVKSMDEGEMDETENAQDSSEDDSDDDSDRKGICVPLNFLHFLNI